MELKNKSRKLFNSVRAMSDILLRRARVKARPIHIHLEVNDYCNLKCFMCPREFPGAKNDTGNMSLEVVEALGPYMNSATHVGLIGNGEPFINPQLMDIVEYIISRGSAPSVITNGTLIKPQVIDELVRVGPMLLLFSIDGATKETFEKIRINARFEKVIDSLMALAEKKKSTGSIYPVLGFVTCLMKDNVHELKQIVELAGKAGVATMVVQKLFPYAEQGMDEHIITDDEMCRRKVEEARALAAQYGIEIRYYEMNVPIYQSIRARDNGNGHHHYYCENAWQQMHVLINGDVRTCCFWTHGNSGNVLKDDPMEIWNNAGIRGPRERMLRGEIPEDCQTCHLLQYHRRGSLVRHHFNQLGEIWKQ